MTEENRNIVTPFAFKVSDSLLGTPLASPAKRLLAISIDMLLVALLTMLSAMILASLLAITLFVGSMNLRKRGKRVAARFVLASSLLCVLIAVIAVIADDSYMRVSFGEDNQVSLQESSYGADIEKVSGDMVAAESEAETDKEPLTEQNSPGLIAWVQGVVTDLGLSFGWSALYFTVFVAWLSGQTPGKRMMGIQVISISGKDLSLWDSFGRYGGYGAGLATGLLGFLQVYWDPNRQAIQDKISETLVVDLKKLRADGDRAIK